MVNLASPIAPDSLALLSVAGVTNRLPWPPRIYVSYGYLNSGPLTLPEITFSF